MVRLVIRSPFKEEKTKIQIPVLTDHPIGLPKSEMSTSPQEEAQESSREAHFGDRKRSLKHQFG
jgi:hypothetical protein